MMVAAGASNELADVEKKIGQLTSRPTKKGTARRPTVRVRHVMVCLDPGDQHPHAVAWSNELCRLFPGVRVTVATVLNPEELLVDYARVQAGSRDITTIKKIEEHEAKVAFESARKQLDAAKSVKHVLARGFPAHELATLARRTKPDVLVVGSHGHGTLERVMLGSVADQVKNHVKCHVLIAKGPVSAGPVLAPVDGSERSRAAAMFGLRIAKEWNESTHILHVFGVNFLRYAEIGEEEFRAVISKHRLPTASEKIHYALDFGTPGKQIVKYAENRHVALVVMGSRGLGALGSAILGGASNRVAHESPVSCLFVKT